MTYPDVSGLPVNLDATYTDDPDNPSRKAHQQHHDLVHAAVKAVPADFLSKTTASATYATKTALEAAVIDGGGGQPDVFNVQSYGATGDGVTDDATAILAAVAAARAANGGVVYFPAGLYLCSQRIDLTYANLVTLRGHHSRLDRKTNNADNQTATETGTPSAELRFTGTGADPFIDFSQSYGTKFEGLTIRYSSSSFTGILAACVYDVAVGTPTYGLIVRECLFGSTSVSLLTAQACLTLNGIIEADIDSCTFSRCQYGIIGMFSADGYSDNVNVKGCRFVDHALWGVLNPKQRWLFLGNTFEINNAITSTGPGGGITSLTLISNGFWDHTGGTWIRLDSYTRGLTISGNRVEVRNAAARFLSLPYAEGVRVSDNWLEGFGGDAKLWATDTSVAELRLDTNFFEGAVDNTDDLPVSQVGFAGMQAPSAPPVRTVTASTTLDVRRCGGLILADATSGPLTVTLHDHDALLRGQEVTVKKTDASANAVTLAAAGGQNIDGSASVVVSATKAAVTVAAHTNGWQVVGSTGAVSGSGTPTATAPAQVTGLTATPGDGSVSLSWTAPSNGGSAITDYVVQRRSPAGSGTYATITDGVSTGTSYLDSGRTNGTSYEYQVAAVNAVGTGAYSAAASATPAAAPAGYTIGGVTGWAAAYDASNVAGNGTTPADNTNLAQWFDLSGNARHASQATTGNQPQYRTVGGGSGLDINGLPTVAFGSLRELATAAAPVTTPEYTLFVVFASNDSISSAGNLFALRDPVDGIPIVGQLVLNAPNASLAVQTRNDASTLQQAVGSTANAIGVAHVASVSASAGGITLYRDGVSEATSSNVSAPASVTRAYIGNYISTAGVPAVIATVLIHPTVLSTADRQAVEAALKAKYGTP